MASLPLIVMASLLLTGLAMPRPLRLVAWHPRRKTAASAWTLARAAMKMTTILAMTVTTVRCLPIQRPRRRPRRRTVCPASLWR
jgi:hypothetical protein